MHLSRSKLHRPTVQTAGHTVTKTTHLLFTSSSNQDLHHPEAFFSPNHCVLISPSTTITHLVLSSASSLAILNPHHSGFSLSSTVQTHTLQPQTRAGLGSHHSQGLFNSNQS